MKIVFYEEYDFLDALKSYLLKYQDKKRIIVLDDYYINFAKVSLGCENFEFCDPNEVSTNLFEDMRFLCFSKSTIFFCEYEFSIQYFFEILSFLDGEKVQLFYDFFDKNLIDFEFKIDEILKFNYLDEDIKSLFQSIVLWKTKFAKFYVMAEKRTFKRFFSIHIHFLNELLKIFDCKLDFSCEIGNLNFLMANCDEKIGVSVYFEYLNGEENINKINSANDIDNSGFPSLGQASPGNERVASNATTYELLGKERPQRMTSNTSGNEKAPYAGFVESTFSGMTSCFYYKTIILTYQNFNSNKALLNEDSINIFYFINSEDVFKKFLESNFIEEAGSYKAELFVIVQQSLRNQIEDEYMVDFLKSFDIRLCSFNNPFIDKDNSKSHSQKLYDDADNEEVLIKLYKKFVKEELINKDVIKLNSFSTSNLINNEVKFLERDVFEINVGKKNNPDYLLSGYFDFILEKIIKQFFKEDCNEDRIIFILREVLDRSYHNFYFGFLFEKMKPIVLNFVSCYKQLISLAEEKKYKIEFLQRIKYDLRLAVNDRNVYLGEKDLIIDCSVFCILKSDKEIILYDVFSKNVDSTSFRSFKKPNIVLAGSYFLRKFPDIKISLKYFNLDFGNSDQDEESEKKLLKELKEKSVRGVNELILKMEEEIFKKLNGYLIFEE